MRKILMGLAMLGFCVSIFGCRTADRARADYHNRRAKEEAKQLNVGKAIDHKKKANDAERDARKDPLP